MSFAIKKIDHIQLAAPMGCEEAAREFFGGILGLIEVEKP
ncbi:glyoxalase, partial [Neobacillus drentensis]